MWDCVSLSQRGTRTVVSLDLVRFVTKPLVLAKKPEIDQFFQAEAPDRAVDMAGRLLECRLSLHKFSKGFFA